MDIRLQTALIRGTRLVSRGLSAALLLSFAIGLVGCNGTPTEQPSATATEDTSAESKAEACRSRLESALRRLLPKSMADVERLDKLVGGLNAWVATCAGEEVLGIPVSDANLALLDTATQRLVTSPRFTATDAAFIRDSVILNRLAQSVASRSVSGDAPSEAGRILNVFRWVIDNISLENPEATPVPKSLFDTVVTGRGTANARAWVFASLLRQLERDAVVVLPSDATDDSEFLVAACLEDRILLLDFRKGLPIPSAGDTSLLVDEPAGVEFLQADERWQKPQIRVIAQSSVVCPRMLVLQEQMPTDYSAGIYEELAGGTSEIRPLMERVTSAAPDVFDQANIKIWDWPNEQVTATSAPDEQQLQQRSDMLKALEAPYEREKLELDTDFRELLSQPGLSQEERAQLWAQRATEEYLKMEELTTTSKLYGRPSSRLLKTRLLQLEDGENPDIIQQLQKIRVACIDDAVSWSVPLQIDPSGRKSVPLPEAIQRVNEQATGDALYWTGLCQKTRNEPGTAISTFQNYRRQYPNGEWFYPSLLNQALAEIRQGRSDAARSTLEEAANDANPEHVRARLLLERLNDAP